MKNIPCYCLFINELINDRVSCRIARIDYWTLHKLIKFLFHFSAFKNWLKLKDPQLITFLFLITNGR